MDSSILKTVKKLLGLAENYNAFDQDIIVYINMSLNILTQLGVGPKEGFIISDATSTWSDFMGDDNRLAMVQNYVHLKVKAIFDTGMSGALSDAVNNQIKELEWRINVQVDPGEEQSNE